MIMNGKLHMEFIRVVTVLANRSHAACWINILFGWANEPDITRTSNVYENLFALTIMSSFFQERRTVNETDLIIMF